MYCGNHASGQGCPSYGLMVGFALSPHPPISPAPLPAPQASPPGFPAPLPPSRVLHFVLQEPNFGARMPLLRLDEVSRRILAFAAGCRSYGSMVALPFLLISPAPLPPALFLLSCRLVEDPEQSRRVRNRGVSVAALACVSPERVEGARVDNPGRFKYRPLHFECVPFVAAFACQRPNSPADSSIGRYICHSGKQSATGIVSYGCDGAV